MCKFVIGEGGEEERIELRFVLLLLLLPNEFGTLDKNSYNFAIYQARTSRFCVVVDLDNTHGLYHAIPYHTIAYQTIPNRTKGISALGVGRDLGVSRGHQGHRPPDDDDDEEEDD